MRYGCCQLLFPQYDLCCLCGVTEHFYFPCSHAESLSRITEDIRINRKYKSFILKTITAVSHSLHYTFLCFLTPQKRNQEYFPPFLQELSVLIHFCASSNVLFTPSQVGTVKFGTLDKELRDMEQLMVGQFVLWLLIFCYRIFDLSVWKIFGK